jgi:hypothetical protein
MGSLTQRAPSPRFAQAGFYALAFFRLDEGTPSAPAPVTQTVRRSHTHLKMKDFAHEIR